VEILSTTTLWGEHWFLIVIMGAVVICIASLAVGIFFEDSGSERYVYVGILTLLLAAGLTMLINLVKDGPDRTFQAIITDFNEVYTNGYEIVERDGKIYTLRESEVK
jgi:hypothetical protein